MGFEAFPVGLSEVGVCSSESRYFDYLSMYFQDDGKMIGAEFDLCGPTC